MAIASSRVAALAAMVLGGATAGQDLSFRASEGATRTKHARVTAELELSASRLTANGREQDREAYGYVATGGGHRIEREVVVTDRYEIVSRGEPYRLRRALDRVRTRGWTRTGPRGGEHDWERVSRLEGAELLFEWDEGANEYDVQLVDDSADLRLSLDEVSYDMDLLALLPMAPAAAGSRWRLDPRDFVTAVLFGGELGAFPRAESTLDGLMEHFPFGGLPSLPKHVGTWIRDLEGDVEARYVEHEERDGTRLARTWIDFELGADVELAREVGHRAWSAFGGLEEAELAWTAFGSAELLWNSTGGHLEALELAATVEARLESEFAYLWDFAQRPTGVQRPSRNRVRSEECWRGTVELSIGLGDPFEGE